MSIPNDAKQLLFQLWRLEKGRSKMVPLPTPSSLMRNDLKTLEIGSYLLAAKHDGVRAILLFGHKAGERYIVFMQRNGRCDSTQAIACPHESTIYCGTALDGELMADGTYHVFDAVAVRGHSCAALPLQERLDMAREVVSEVTGPVYVKEFTAGKECGTFLRAFAAQPEKNVDGIILAPQNDPVGVGRLVKYFKYKPLDHVTVDLHWDPMSKLLRCGPPGNELIEAALRDIKWHDADFAEYKSGIVECSFIASGNEYTIKPKMQRDDKDTANSQFVVQRTMQNLKEDIKVEDIDRALGCVDE